MIKNKNMAIELQYNSYRKQSNSRRKKKTFFCGKKLENENTPSQPNIFRDPPKTDHNYSMKCYDDYIGNCFDLISKKHTKLLNFQQNSEKDIIIWFLIYQDTN